MDDGVISTQWRILVHFSARGWKVFSCWSFLSLFLWNPAIEYILCQNKYISNDAILQEFIRTSCNNNNRYNRRDQVSHCDEIVSVALPLNSNRTVWYTLNTFLWTLSHHSKNSNETRRGKNRVSNAEIGRLSIQRDILGVCEKSEPCIFRTAKIN